MPDLYPHTFLEWIALFGALTPFIGLAGGAIWRAWTYHREQRQKEWERLHDLLKTLYNKNNEYGEWAQLAAVCELNTVRINQVTLAVIVANVMTHWTNVGASPQLINELKRLQTSLPTAPQQY